MLFHWSSLCGGQVEYVQQAHPNIVRKLPHKSMRFANMRFDQFSVDPIYFVLHLIQSLL